MQVLKYLAILTVLAASSADGALLLNEGRQAKDAVEIILKNLRPNRCTIVISSDTAQIESDDYVYSLFIQRVPTLLLENFDVANVLVQKENCLDFFLRLGHDCCGFFRAITNQVWKRTAVRAEGVILVNLEENALEKNCLPCVQQITHAEDVSDVSVFKDGKFLNRFKSGENLAGKTLEVAAIRYPPFVIYPEGTTSLEIQLDTEQNIEELDGTELRLLRHFSQKFNFSARVVLRHQGELWGMVYENGSSSGVLGQVYCGNTQIGIGGFNWDTRYSGKHVDQLLPYRRTLVKFLSPRRLPSANWLALVRSFHSDVWLAVGGIVLASSLCLWFAHWTETGHCDFTVSCLLALGVLAQQGDVPKYWCRGMRRGILVGLQTGVILLGASYCALLVAVLTLDQPAPQVDTVQQLADSNLRYTDTDDVWPGQLQISDDPNIEEIMGRFEMSGSWEELKRKLLSNKFTYTAECLDNGYLCLQEELGQEYLENLHLAKDFVLASEIGMVLAKGLPLKKAFDREVSHLVESGLLSLWEQQVVAKAPDRDMGLLMKKRSVLSSSPLTLGISHLGGPFLMLVVGLLLAALAFCLEILFF